MEFISVQQAAANFGVTVRTVQKWAKEGKIKGAMRVGKVWLIPQNAVHPYESKNVAVGHEEWLCNTNRFEYLPFRLICADFAPGKSLDYIEAINDTKIKNFSEAEYHFFKGNSERCIEIVEKYISDSDDTIAVCSGLMYAVANLSIGNYRVARMTFDNMSKYMSTKEFAERDIKNESMTFFASLIIDILIHSTKADIVKLREIMQYLPDGMRLFGAYLMAILAYINGDHSRVVGIADTAISLCPYVHMVPMIYLHIIAAIGLINMKMIEEAKIRFRTAVDLAAAEGFWAPFIQHHGILLGLPESCMREAFSAEFRYIAAGARDFIKGWCNLDNAGEEGSVLEELTTIEFVIAMLFSKDWSMKEISFYLKISLRMVKQHISTVYLKLGITKREELKNYMLI